MDGYRMEKTLLTSSDMQAILAGLRSLDSVSKTGRYRQLMDKLSMGNDSVLSMDKHIMIDLSSWYKSSLAPKIEAIQRAISNSQVLEFWYYSPKGEEQRRIEPYLLVFQWASWYVWGYALERSDYRLFKLNRIQKLNLTGDTFEPREHQEYKFSRERVYPVTINVKAIVEPEMKWRLVEEFGIESFTEQENGKLLFRFGFADRENLFGWLLSFGDQAELLEPVELREEIAKLAGRISEKYGEGHSAEDREEHSGK